MSYKRMGLAVLAAVLVSPVAWTQAEAAEDPATLPPCGAVTHRNAINGKCIGPDGEVLDWVRVDGPSTFLDPVEVYGDRAQQAPGSRAVLDAALIADVAADHPAEILNQAPAVNIQMNSGQEHLIAIRSPVLTGGAGQGSFLILENGVPVRSPAFGNVNSLIEPHHEIADTIEIIRGPASAKYGSNAVHGLLNFILPDASSPQRLRLSYNTLDRWRADASVNLGSATRLSLSLMDDAGWRDATPTQQQKLSATTTATLGGWDSAFWLAASSLNQETASFIQGPDAYKDRDLAETNPNPEAYRDAWSARLGARLSRELGPGTLSLMPNLHSQAMIFSQHFLPYGGVEKNAHTGGGVLARYELAPTGPVQWRFGADTDFASGYLREIQPGPHPSPNFPQGVHYDYTVDTAVYALWAEADWQLTDNLRLLAGLRGETHAYDYTTRAPTGINGRFNVPAARSDDFTFLTPKLGLVWDQPWGALYANYARGARAPQVSDLYRLQSLQLPGEIETETADSLELGVRGLAFAGRLDYDIAAWWMEKENFFFRDSDGLNVPDGSTRHFGIDAQAGWTFTDNISLSGNLAWSDQTYTFNRPVNAAQERIVDGNAIDTAPEWLADARLSWQATGALRFALTAEHVGEYFMDPANTVTYPGHTVFGARAGYQLAEGFEVYLLIRNLTDEAYADRADVGFGNERYFPGEPVNAVFGLTRTF